jgi:hypothetical protein
LPDLAYIKKRHACVQGILPGLREDVSICADCNTSYPCDARLLAEFIEKISLDLRQIANNKLTEVEVIWMAKEILAQIRR